MLLEFRFANFRCFRDEQVFSLVASSDKSHPGNVVELPIRKGLRLVKSAVIYGANASGKTTLLDALSFFIQYVRTSASEKPAKGIAVDPFLLDSSSGTSPSSFEATFVAEDGVLYQYGFTLDRTRVLKEWLNSFPMGRPRRLFRRLADDEGEVFDFGSHLKGEKEKLRELTRPTVLFLSVGATFNNPQLSAVYSWFSEDVGGVQAGRVNEGLWLPFAMGKEEHFGKVRELLKNADLGIVDFSFRETAASYDDLPEDAPEAFRNAWKVLMEGVAESEPRRLNVEVMHQGAERSVGFDLRRESNGTRQLFVLSFFILSKLAKGGVLFVDELDASLHPKLVQALIKLFHDPQANPKDAQLIFNTHDTTLLSAEIFRRDQIWFVEKDADGASCAYSLLEYSPRKDESLERGYLQGRYGATPFLGESIGWIRTNDQK